MERNTKGDPRILKNSYTRFQVHFMDLNRLLERLREESIPFFAKEHVVEQETWIFYVPDQNRERFDEILVNMKLNSASLTQSVWYQDRDRDAWQDGLKSKKAMRTLAFIVVVMGLIALLGWLLDK